MESHTQLLLLLQRFLLLEHLLRLSGSSQMFLERRSHKQNTVFELVKRKEAGADAFIGCCSPTWFDSGGGKKRKQNKGLILASRRIQDYFCTLLRKDWT